MAAPLPDLLTVAEVATALRTTPKAVYAMVERGQLPGVVRLGRRLRVDGAALLRFINEGRAPSPEGVRR